TLDNTLDKLLDPKQDFSLEWKPQAPGVGAHSNPGKHLVTMNVNEVAANNAPLDLTNIQAPYQAVNALPHEINHAIDNVHVANTYEYLDKEYQAYYTGSQAQSGETMSRQDAARTWQTLLDTNGIYGGAAKGALGNKDEAQKIFDEIARLTGVKVDAGNYNQILQDPSKWQPPGSSSSQPIPPGAEPQGNTNNR
ncbi:MAG: hypothetical protein ACREP7_12735, partial [Lysobacter sp.]